MLNPLQIAFDFIDQDVNPACFYNRKTKKIEYTNKILDQISLDRDFLLTKIKDYGTGFKQGMQVELFGKKYDAHVFDFSYDDVNGAIVTIRVTASMHLEVTMDAFEKIIEHMSDAILITDKSFNLVYANQAYKNLMFLNTDEYKSRKLSLFDESKHPAKYIKSIWRQIEKTQEWRGETWVLRNDGSHKMVWLQLFSVLDEAHSVDLYVASYKNYSKAIPDSEELLHLLSRDVLTNLYNRYYFLEHVSKELASNPDKQQFICFIDMDSFKQVNDTYGHMYGDMILAKIATNLKEIFVGHVVARYGGDEFVVYFSLGTTIEQIENYQAMFEIKITSFLKQILDNMNVSASIGVAEYPKDGTTVQELISSADVRMYVDKKE